MEMYADLVKMESTFDVKPWIEWHNSHIELPIFAISLYLVFIFYVPDIIKDNKIKMHLKLTMAGWNLALSTAAWTRQTAAPSRPPTTPIATKLKSSSSSQWPWE